MGLRNLDKIAQALMRGGLPSSTPAAVIASATLTDQRVLASTLDSIASEAHAAHIAAPAMVVIGEIVRTRQQLWDASAHAAASAPRSACEG
jgi:siroheme synthase